MTLVERVAEWPKQWHREGLAEGMAQQRTMLCRQATRRFGDAVGAQLELLLADIEDWDRLGTVGDLILSAENGPEFTRCVADLLRRSD